jgi:hypothetical protein
MVTTMDDGFGHWFAGFTDGEGCFFIGQYTPRFTLGLRADDWQVLEYTRQQLGIGMLRRRPGTKKSKPSAVFEVWRPQEQLVLVDLFERFPLRAKKRHQFEVWCTAVREAAKGRLKDKSVINNCRRRLATLRVYDTAAFEEVILTVRARQSIRVDDGLPPYCLCGCGRETGPITHGGTTPHPDNVRFNRFVRGHHRRLLFADLDLGTAPLCMCGCGESTREIASVNYKTLFHPDNMHFRRFVNGHNRRGLRFLRGS